jgi:hypothetical protein
MKTFKVALGIYMLSAFANFSAVQADTGIDGAAMTSSSFTMTGLVSISSLTANSIFSSGLNVSTITAVSSATITNLTVGTLTTSSILGKVIQTVMSTSTSAGSTTSTSFVDSGVSATITPTSASNKILIMAWTNLESDSSAGGFAFATLANGSTNLLAANGEGFCHANSAVTAINCPLSLGYLDTPTTTSVVTYKVRVKVDAGTTTAFWGGDSSHTQVMILEEIAP